MDDLWAALGLVLVLEGLIYALFPDAMKRMMVQIMSVPPETLRVAGLAFATVGVLVVWLVRG